MKNSIVYKVEPGNFLSGWLLSEIEEVPFDMEPVPDVFPGYHMGIGTRDENGVERVSPPKKEYLRRGDFRRIGYPASVITNRLYWPFDTGKVDQSGFWFYPCSITFYAKAFLFSETGGAAKFELFASGGVKVWLNGVQAASFYPYHANIEDICPITLDLKPGENELLVACNNFGERNIVFKFGLMSINRPLEVRLPVVADISRITDVNRILEGMYLEQLSYDEGLLNICLAEPLAEPLEISVSVDGNPKAFTLLPETRIVKLGDVADIFAGYKEITVESVIDGLVIKHNLYAEVYPEHLNIQAAPTVAQRKKQTLQYMADSTMVYPERCYALFALGQQPDYADQLNDILDKMNKRPDCIDFRVISLMWMLNKFRNKLTPDEWARSKDALLGFRYWFDEPGNDVMWFYSENHALSFHVCQQLAGEMFPGDTFTNSGRTGIQQAKRAKELLLEWFDMLFAHGYNEWNSAIYISVDVKAFLTLYEFTQDAELKALARRALDDTFRLYAENNFHGLMAGSDGRVYTRDLIGSRSITANSLFWMAWGEGFLGAVPIVYFALSDYEPPESLVATACPKSDKQMIFTRKQGVRGVPTVICKTRDYAIATCQSPLAGRPGSQEHLLNIYIKDYRLRIWVNHPGEAKLFGTRRPGHFNGNGLTPYVYQQENTAVLVYDFPEALIEAAEVQHTQAFCDINAAEECRLKGNWFFLRREGIYVALYARNGLGISKKIPLADRVLISPGINNIWLARVCTQKEAGTFDAFMQSMGEMDINAGFIEGFISGALK